MYYVLGLFLLTHEFCYFFAEQSPVTVFVSIIHDLGVIYSSSADHGLLCSARLGSWVGLLYRAGVARAFSHHTAAHRSGSFFCRNTTSSPFIYMKVHERRLDLIYFIEQPDTSLQGSFPYTKLSWFYG